MRFIIPGKPVAWARSGHFGKQHYDQQRKERTAWKAEAYKQYWQNKYKIINEPLKAWFLFGFKIPKGKKKLLKPGAPYYAVGRHDIDNLIKWCMDCLEGIAYKNDSQIIELGHVKKCYWPENITEISLEPVIIAPTAKTVIKEEQARKIIKDLYNNPGAR